MKIKKMKGTNEHIVPVSEIIHLLLNINSSLCLCQLQLLAPDSVSSCFVWNLFLALVLTLGGC